MKKITYLLIAACLPIAGVSAASLNEWAFNKDAAGLMLSQTTNSGVEQAVFSTGGGGYLETDGKGLLVCTRSGSGTDDMWQDGAVLDADVNDISSGYHYFRCDLSYDLSAVENTVGLAFGLSVVDNSGTNVAGVFLAYTDSPAPSGKAMQALATNLTWSGKISAIVQVDIDAQTLTAWYDLSGANSFTETYPAVSNVPISL
ncbi:MAG: hypothetical protein AB7E95_13850, partial [Kiritimatiellales bacterium]